MASAKQVKHIAYPIARNIKIVPNITARSCGPLHITALVEKLIRLKATEEHLRDVEGEDDIADKQDEYLGDLTRTVYK